MGTATVHVMLRTRHLLQAALVVVGLALAGASGFGAAVGRDGEEAPQITEVHPSPLVGANTKRWITLIGRRFEEGFTVRLRTDSIDAHIRDRSQLRFISAQRVQVKVTLGTEAVTWEVQVYSPAGDASAPYPIHTRAPVPEIETVTPIRKAEGEPGFVLTVYGETLTAYSVIYWNGERRPTTPVFSSDKPNAVTIGLRTRISSADIARIGTQQVRVFTPPPGGGWSEPAVLFTVERYFYQSPWFYLVCGGVLLVVGFGIHRYRLKHLRERELAREVEERTRSLRAEKRKTERQARQLQKQAHQLRELDRMKSRFFANVSHEFRTPLAMILGPARDLLEEGEASIGAEARRQLEVIERNAQRIERLINQLLDLAAMETGQEKLDLAQADLIDFLEETIRSFAPMAERNRVRLEFRPELERLEWAFDVEKLSTIVGNLLSNALKFTSEGGTVRVTVEETNDEAVLRVRDTGPGIPEEERARIFDRFYQVDGGSTRTHGGVGIGLALAEDFVELHGGSIEVESEPGFGSEFVVRLPRPVDGEGEAPPRAQKNERRGAPTSKWVDVSPEPEETESHAEKPEPHGAAKEASTVLVVEDDTDVRTYLRTRLAPRYHVVEAEGGTQALERIDERRPDLVLSDVMMPEMDGFELCRRLKTDERFQDLPVILLTARTETAGEVEGFDVGADAYVEKPFDAEVLEAQIENLIAGRRRLREQYSREVVIQPSEVTVTSEGEAFLRRVRDIAEEHLSDRHFTVEAFAAEVGLSKSQLTRKLKKTSGFTPAAFVRELRLKRAMQLIEQDAGSISDVAGMVGFADAEYFSKLFRERFGAPPSQYSGEK